MPFVSVHAQTDSTIKLNYDNFLGIVKKYHPIAKQSELLLKSSEANLLKARGNFDPKLFYNFENKYYSDKNYFQLGNGGFSIPTWYGVEIKGGVEQNRGDYLNPQNNTPLEGLAYAEISVPLLQGLVIDERRAALKQAKFFINQTEAEQKNVLNKLLYDAGKSYLDWQLSYLNLQIHKYSVDISKERLISIIQTANLGDRPYIDTVEAMIQFQERNINLQQALLDYKIKSLLLSNFLWYENNTPVTLTGNTVPENLNLDTVVNDLSNLDMQSLDSIANLHPNILVYKYKLKQLEIEQKLKREKLKPNFNVKYNPIQSTNSIGQNFLNNYKYGVSIEFPLFLRKERGDLKLTNLKLKDLNFETDLKRLEIENKIKASLAEFSNYKNQIRLFTNNLENYERLWISEKNLFDSGESSLFMINSREMSYINSRIKYNESYFKFRKSILDANYSLGILNSLF